MSDYKITWAEHVKRLISPDYNYIFDSRNGMFARWGKTVTDDPGYSKYGPELLDIEVTTKCTGISNLGPCPFCYKSNSPVGENMSLETFKRVLDNLPDTLNQVAFGADAKASTNPDLFPMMAYCRSKRIIPNITVADITQETADKLSLVCGAVAVSRYADKNICYESVSNLLNALHDNTHATLTQVNIHQLICEETFEQTLETIADISTDPRLTRLNAIIFLALKNKGRGTGYTTLSEVHYNELLEKAKGMKTCMMGFDACSAGRALSGLTPPGHPNRDFMLMQISPCDSFAMFSSYINVKGEYYPCSFCEGSNVDFMQGPNVATCSNFLDDIWNSDKMIIWRHKMITRFHNQDYSCPIFKI